MVDPVSDAERSSFYRRFKIGLAVLVGLSGALVAFQAGAAAVEAAGAAVGGFLVGLAIAWYVLPDGSPMRSQRRRDRHENPFADGNGRAAEGEGRSEADDAGERRRHDADDRY